MSDDAQRWKTKYLENLEQQERLERRWKERFDLLRRGLVRSSLAAEGSDKAVDQCLLELREILRHEDIDADLAALVPRLERAVLDSERRRQERVVQLTSALTALASQLQDLPLPREVRKPLKQFTKQLEERAGQMRELPLLLGELSELQRNALAMLENSVAQRPGLLQRLFGERQAAVEPPAQDSAPQATTADPAAPAPQPPAPVAEPLPTIPTATAEAPPVSPVVTPDDPAFALPTAPEPGYSAIAEHVEATLLGLLEELPLPEHHRAQGEDLAERIRQGLNWYELVPVLDDLAVLMLAVADLGQREFEGYLKQLNERLAAFQGNLQEAHEGYSETLNAARELDNELREQVGGLHDSVREATDLASLKQAVESRLDGLLNTMDQYQRQREEQEQAVAARLQTLVERVASMEQEARDFRDHIEEQRQKALSDPLTGLPNRAAWNERLELEQARWQRYGGDLLLAVLDVDHFKRINDNYGHLAGDKVLKIIAGELARRLRKTDFMARYGGEEFVLLLPGTPLEGGLQLLETLRAAVEACPFHFKGEPVTITLSAGVTAFSAGQSAEKTFECADQALYRAKNGGRNRIEVG